MADKNYSEAGFWQKLNTFARKAGHDLVEKSLQLYYAAESPETPTWARGVVFGALAYFVAPIDAIPDVTPGIGFTDDLGVLIGAVVRCCRTYHARSQRRQAPGYNRSAAFWFDSKEDWSYPACVDSVEDSPQSSCAISYLHR